MLVFQGLAQEWVSISSDTPTPVKKELVSSDVNTTVVKFTLDGFYKQKVETPNGIAYTITTGDATPILKAGAPDVAKATASVIIPDMDEMEISVINVYTKTYENIEVAPSKGNLYRDVNPDDVPFEYGEEYEQDAFYPANHATLRTPYILRDYRGQTIVVNPFRYNPVKKELRVATEIEVKITSTGNTGENALFRESELTTIDREFGNIYNGQFLNYANDSRYTPLEEDGSILIIAYGDFMDAMQPYIDWKIMTGREVEMIDVAEIGGSSEIEAYIETYYNENDLTYCLLIGDGDQVPTSYANGDSDNNYAYIEGNDSYPEIFMGRFSAESVADVETQVARTVNYEKEPFTGEEWYPNSISIGSDDGTGSQGDDGENDWEHLRNIQDDLNGFGYTYNYEFFEGSQGGNDGAGNPDSESVGDAINSGATIINYTGHGSTTAWTTSGFNNGDVNDLVNAGKLPFIWSVACVNGDFDGPTCFAEAWLRATDSENNPTGAVAMMASTINQSWNPPMHGQDEMNDILTEQYDDNIKRTFGGLSMNGCMEMNDEYGSQGDDMTDTWVLFGDPSVMVRTNNPTEITASHNPTVFLGSTSFTVNATGVDGATVAMTMDGQIYGTATIEGGTATVDFDEPLNEPGMMNLVITGFNKIPYIAELEVIPAEGPFVTLASFELTDENGNGNADFGETVAITVDLENIGIEAATDAVATITTDDEYVTITDGEEAAGTIEADATVTLTDAFEITVAEDIPDQHMVTFTLTTTAGDDTWENMFNITLNAPVFNSGMITVDDSEEGNNNGRLDPGETVTVIIPGLNLGHADATDVQAHLSTLSGYASVVTTIYNVGTLEAGGEANTEFTLSCNASTPIGTVIALDFELEDGPYVHEKEYALTAGLILEDWESGTFDGFNWQFSGTADWSVVEGIAFEGNSSAQSDDIGDSQSAEMYLEYEVMQDDSISFYRKVSSEQSYDYLQFYIDGDLMDEWAGEIDWGRKAYAVSAGPHTFKWVYDKDGSQSNGDDCAWIDYIILPPEMSMTASAGPDMAVCGEVECVVYGDANMYESIEWTTEGDGYFDDPTALQPVYHMGAQDMENGEVMLTIHVTGNDDVMTDDMMLTYNEMPTAFAGEDTVMCASEELVLDEATAENNAAVQWATAGTGTFEDGSILNTTYTPSEEDIAAGSVTLTLVAQGMEGCGDAMAEIDVTINDVPAAPAMPAGNAELCAGTAAEYTVEAVANADTYTWTVVPAEAATIEGDSETATFTWAEDFSGEAQLTVHAANTCGDGAAAEMLTVNVNAMPTATFTSDVTEVDHAYIDTTAFASSDAADYTAVSWSVEPAEAVTEIIDNGENAEMVWNDSYTGEATVKFHLTNDCGEVVMEHGLVMKSTVGIGEDELYSASVFPNPNDGSFKLQLSSDKAQKISIRVMSPLGKVVYDQNNIQFNDRYETTIDIENASNGVYYLVIESDNARRVEKIIVK